MGVIKNHCWGLNSEKMKNSRLLLSILYVVCVGLFVGLFTEYILCRLSSLITVVFRIPQSLVVLEDTERLTTVL